jgi:5-methylthioadenosine/S-adenosylhomocysteine deaminase
LVRDDQIADIGPSAQLRQRYPQEPETDYGLAAILPGFIDCHTHLEYSVLRGLVHDSPYAAWKLRLSKKERLLTTMDWEDSAALGVLEALRSGVTTIADITDTGAPFRAAANVGLRGVIYRECGTVDRHKLDFVFDQATQDIAEWREHERGRQLLRIGIAPTALYKCHPEMFHKIAAYATDGTPVALHLAGSREEYDFVRYGASPFSVHATEVEGEGYSIEMPPWLATGVSPVQYVLNWGILDVPNVLAVHCVHVDDADIEALAERDVAVALCSRCNAQLAMGVAPLPKFIRAGLCLGLGTDSPAATDATDMIAEMRIGMLIQRAVAGRIKFVTAQRMLELGTLGSARALGLSDQVGSLEPGKQADIICLDLSNSNQAPTHDPNSAIVNTATQDNVLLTMIAGKILYDGHHRSGLDVERIFARAEEIRQKLRSNH